jgi:membrane protease YdiL (CAAX protease family)
LQDEKTTGWGISFNLSCVDFLSRNISSYIDILAGILFHIAILFVLFVHYGFITNDKMSFNIIQWRFIREKKKPSSLAQLFIDRRNRLSSLILALTLVPLIRILSLVMPLSTFAPIYWFIIIGVAVYLAFIALVIQQRIELKECGIRLPKLKHLPLEIGIILLAVPLGVAEYYILRPLPVIDSFSITNIVIAVLILFIATGLMEELIFRGLIQKKAIAILGPWKGILFVTFIFAMLHIGNLSILDVLLVFSIGGAYSIIVYKTKTIIGVTISHTVVNMFLFIICPLTIA